MKEAFNQICRYKAHSYTGLFRYIQIFVVSNGVDTKYFANSDGDLNYKYTFFWTDKENNRITNLKDLVQHSQKNAIYLCYASKKYNKTQLKLQRPYPNFNYLNLS